MDSRKLRTALDLAAATGYVLIATASPEGVPHVAAARQLSLSPSGELAVSEWFCPGTVANLSANLNISIVAWDPGSDTGVQILGILKRVEDLAIMDGYSPDEPQSLPQVQKRLIVQPLKIIHFSHAPHSDVE